MWEEENKIDDSEFRQFLAEQIALPQEQWDERFRQYVEKKHRDSLEEIPEYSPEEEQERNFQRYLKSLDLSKEELANKKILDLGCGEGDFVKFCLGQGISREVYGLDIQIESEQINPAFRKHFLKGNFEEELPIKELDYIISVAGVEAPPSEEIESRLRRILVLALMAIQHNGEIRIFPIRKAAIRSGLKAIEFSWKKWREVLEDLSAKGLIDYEIRPIDIRTGGNKPDVWLEQVLIIRRKVN